MRAALFAPVNQNDTDRIGHLTESAIFSQWQHSLASRQLRYARWRNEGEVDIVYLNEASDRPSWIGEIKWSDRSQKNFVQETRSIRTLLGKHETIESCFLTSRTWSGLRQIEGRELRIIPSALYCYTVGRNLTARLSSPIVEQMVEEPIAEDEEQ